MLKEKVDLLIRRLFGAKSEKLDVAQLELLLKKEACLTRRPRSPNSGSSLNSLSGSRGVCSNEGPNGSWRPNQSFYGFRPD